MARNSSFERRLLKSLKPIAGSGRSGRGKRNPFGRGGMGAFWSLLVLVLIVCFQVRDGWSPSKNEPSTDPSSETTFEPFSADETEFDSTSTSFDRNETSNSTASDRETVAVERCVDGDTFVVRRRDGSTERVRLIGANTPETVKPNWPVEPFGPEASAFSKRRVEEAGGVATLVSDGDRTDRYGRRLAFLYLADSEISLNEELALAGLAKVETKYRYSTEMKNRLRAAEKAAKQAKRGIYSTAS